MPNRQLIPYFRFSRFFLPFVFVFCIALGARAQSVPIGTCTPPVTANFDDVTTLPGAGWVQINHSEPIGKGVWAQGNPLGYPAQTGNPDAYIIVNFDSGSLTATLNNWLLTPTLVLQNGDSITFWTRTVTDVMFPDRLQVRLSTNGPSTDVGTTATQVGDFTTLLLDINPTYLPGGVGSYPTDWTQFTATVTGVPSPIAARFAFRYFVENGGPGGNNSDGIGLDTVTVNSCNAPPGISGTVTYGNAIPAATRFVSNVQVSGAGSIPVSALTGFPGGTYSLSGFGAGSYTVTPSKTGGVNGAISSFDAGRISQHVAGPPLPHLTGNQLVVADVSGNGAISSFDAGMIAKFVAGPPYAAPGIGLSATWKFFTIANVPLPPGTTPTSRTYASVTSSVVGEDYTGLLMGEISGNWTNTGARAVNSEQWTMNSESSGPERGINVRLPQMTNLAEKEIVIPVSVEGVEDKGIISYEFDLRYDPAVIQPQADPVDLKGTVSRGLFAVANANKPGLLRVVMYGPLPIDENGLLLNLRFQAVGASGSMSPLIWERIIFNEGTPRITAANGLIELVP